jgi:hypothetical protein
MIYERVHPEFMCFWLVKHFFYVHCRELKSNKQRLSSALSRPLKPSRGGNRFSLFRYIFATASSPGTRIYNAAQAIDICFK